MYAPTDAVHAHSQPQVQSHQPPIPHRNSPSVASVHTIRAAPPAPAAGEADPFLDHRYPYPFAAIPYPASQQAALSPTHPYHDLHGPPQHHGRHGSGSHSHASFPPVPPARTSSLHQHHQQLGGGAHAAIASGSGSGPGSPSTRRVPSVQVIHPTPTKKKGRPRSTASGDTAIAGGSPRARGRPDSMMSTSTVEEGCRGTTGQGQGLEVLDSEAAREEAKKTRAREKGRERQRRKRERDKALKERGMLGGSRSSSNLTSSVPMSVPSSASSTYSSLPHSLSHSYLSLSPGHSFAFSTSSTSISGQSSPSALFSPAVSTSTSMGDILWAGSKTSRRTSNAPSVGSVSVAASTNGMQMSPPPKRRKSEPEPEELRAVGVGLGVTWPEGQEEGRAPNVQEGHDLETIRRPRPRRTISLAATETSQSLPDTPASGGDWPRSPTPPPLPLPSAFAQSTHPTADTGSMPTRRDTSSQGHLFASLVIHACDAPGVAASLQSQLGISKKTMHGLREEIGAVYDRWMKGLEQGMGAVTLDEAKQTTSPETFTPQRPRAETQVAPAQPNTHGRTRSFSSASMLARGLVLTSVPTTAKWDSPTGLPGPGSDSPTHSNLQTPSTGQGTSFVIPNQPLPAEMSQQGSHAVGHAHVHARSQTEPMSKEWRAVSPMMAMGMGLESPLAMTKTRAGRAQQAAQATGSGSAISHAGDGGRSGDRSGAPANLHSTPPHATTQDHSMSTPASHQPYHNQAQGQSQRPMFMPQHPHPYGYPYAHGQPFPQPVFIPALHSASGAASSTSGAANGQYAVPWTPTTATAAAGATSTAQTPSNRSHMPGQGITRPLLPMPFTPSTPVPLRGGEAPAWYHPSFLAHQGTPTQAQGYYPQTQTPGQVPHGGMMGQLPAYGQVPPMPDVPGMTGQEHLQDQGNGQLLCQAQGQEPPVMSPMTSTGLSRNPSQSLTHSTDVSPILSMSLPLPLQAGMVDMQGVGEGDG